MSNFGRSLFTAPRNLPTRKINTMSNIESQTIIPDPSYLEKTDGAMIAYHRLAGRSPGIIFFGGFASDMTGTKAMAIESYARNRGQAFLRFDYQGHGQSSGEFSDGTIGTWLSDSLAVLDAQTEGPQILIGSSMGGWLTLLTALKRPERIKALIGIASAPDFTEDLMWDKFDELTKNALLKEGIYYEPTEYDEQPYTITLPLIEDGRTHLVLRDRLGINVPIRLLHGMSDADVPYEVSLKLAEHVVSDDVEVILIKDGDHRLSTSKDLMILTAQIEKLLCTNLKPD